MELFCLYDREDYMNQHVLDGITGMGYLLSLIHISERNANGRFKDIYDLMERVNFSAVNRKCFENLAYAGGFD